MEKYTPLVAPNFEPEDVVESEVVQHRLATNERSIARRIALQVLYEVDIANHPFGDVLNSQLMYSTLNPKTTEYLGQLVNGVIENKDILDNTIQEYAPEWPLDQVAAIDRNILRLSVNEIVLIGNISEKIVIDEAVELGKSFGAEGTPLFVNGVLGAMVSEFDKVKEMLNKRD